MRDINPVRDYTLVVLAIFAGMLLTILPLPQFAIWLRPQWVLLILLFMTMTLPNRLGVGTAFVVGILMDLLTGTWLGQHAMAYVMVVFLMLRFFPQLRLFPSWQQVLVVLGLLAINLGFQYLVMMLTSNTPQTWAYWWSALSTLFLWPWTRLLVHESR